MAYRLLHPAGDSVQVPQLVINNLNNGREEYFRVALYMLATGKCDPQLLQQDLGLKNEAAAKRALAFWQGAGLVEEVRSQPLPELKQDKPRLTTREVLIHSGSNPEIAVLMQEAQRIFGEVISQSGCSTLASMYINDKMPLDYLLLGLAHFASQGFTAKKLSTVQRRMQGWQEQGVTTMVQLEEHLALQEQRGINHAEVARLLNRSADTLTTLERNKINIWYEKYHYSEPVISLALSMAAGADIKSMVAYLHSILTRWYGEGHRQLRDVLAAEQGSNIMPVGRTAPARDTSVAEHGVRVPKFRLDED